MKAASLSRGGSERTAANVSPSSRNAASNKGNSNSASKKNGSKKRKINGGTKNSMAPAPRERQSLLPIGSLVYRRAVWEQPAKHRRAHGDMVAMVTKHGKDAGGPFATAQEMLLSSPSDRFINDPFKYMGTINFGNNNNNGNNNRNNTMGLELALAPVALKSRGKTVTLRSFVHPEFPSRIFADAGLRMWRPLAYGQKIYDVRIIHSKTHKKLVEARRRAATRLIARVRAGKRAAMNNAQVKNALESPAKFYVDAHGSLRKSTFTVPDGVCIVFVTSPGACAFERDVDNRTAKRLIMTVDGTVYSAPYFAGDTVQDHDLFFSEKEEDLGIYKIPFSTNEKDKVKFFQYNTNKKKTTLCRLAQSVSKLRQTSHSQGNLPTVLIVGSCRSPGDNFDEHNFDDMMIIRNVFAKNNAARRRVGGLSIKSPNTVKNAKRIGESAYMRKLLQNAHLLKHVEESGVVV